MIKVLKILMFLVAMIFGVWVLFVGFRPSEVSTDPRLSEIASGIGLNNVYVEAGDLTARSHLGNIYVDKSVLDKWTDDELRFVIAHEAGHIANYHQTIKAILIVFGIVAFMLSVRKRKLFLKKALVLVWCFASGLVVLCNFNEIQADWYAVRLVNPSLVVVDSVLTDDDDILHPSKQSRIRMMFK